MSKQARNALLALGVVIVAIAYLVSSGGDGGYTVKAELANAGGLRQNSSVKIAGVPAGKVEKLEVTDRDTAIATLKIDEGAAPVGRGASLNVRPTDLLGERYAEIKVGNIEDPLPSGSMIPRSATATPVELDDILNMLDVDTRQRLGILINETGVALAGRGADFNTLLSQLPSSLEETEKLLEQVHAENVALQQGVQRADRVTKLVNDRREDMGALVREAGDALELVADKRTELAGTIRNAPGALSQLRGTLANLDTAATQLRPAARDLQATAEPLKQTLDALPEFAEAAGPALDKARDVSPSLTRLARQATPTVKALEPTTRNAERALAESAPILKHMSRRGWDDVLFFVNNMNLGLRGRDGTGHFIGAKLNIAAEYIDNAVENFTNVDLSTPAKKRRAGTKPSVPKVEDPLKSLVDDVRRKATDPLKKTVEDLTDTIVPKVADRAGEVVGGVIKQVGGLGSALGGENKGAQPKSEGSDALRLFDYLMGQ